jgi:hypothetical protein
VSVLRRLVTTAQEVRRFDAIGRMKRLRARRIEHRLRQCRYATTIIAGNVAARLINVRFGHFADSSRTSREVPAAQPTKPTWSTRGRLMAVGTF